MTTINVSNLTELYDALASAKGGETIALAGGEYGDMVLSMKSGFDLTFASNVTITSADAQDPAVFSGLDLRDVTNLTFDGVTFDYTFEEGDNVYDRPFQVSDSENINFHNSTFDGDIAQGVSAVDDGYGYAIGLSVRDSVGISVENNEFFDFARGAIVTQSADVSVIENDIHSIRIDGLNFAEIKGIEVEGNYIHDFKGSPNSNDHSDMIQFWTNGTDSPSTDIIIRGNHLDIGSGSPTQSIFMRNDQVDQGFVGAEMFYQNLLIEENVIINGHAHGITVGETNNLTIRNNSVLHSDGAQADGKDAYVEIPRIKVSQDSTNVSITQNATAQLDGYNAQADWHVNNNAFVQDQDSTQPGYYGDVFLTSSLQAVDGVHDFRAMPGGMLDTLNAGASATQDTYATESLSAQFHVETNEDSAALHHFDASFTSSDTGTLPQGTTFHWDFGDGTKATGAQVDHSFASAGTFGVSLSVELPDGTTNTRQFSLDVAGAQVFSYTADDGAFAHESGLAAAVALGASQTSEGVALSEKGVSVQIARDHIERMLDTQELSIDMTLSAENANSMGEVMRLHGSFVTSVTQTGEVHLLAFTEDGARIRLTTQGADMQDGNPHDINISLSNGVLSLSVDGGPAASTNLQGNLGSEETQDMVFGNPWNGQNFEGTLSEFSINVNESQFTGIPSTTYIAAPAAVATTHYAPLTEKDVSVSTETVDPLEALLKMAEKEREADISGPGEAPVTLGAAGTSAHIAREDLSDILTQEDFGISMTLSGAGQDSAGEVVRLHQSFVVNVTESGEVNLQIFSEDGTRHRLTTEGADLMDQANHTVLVSRNDGVVSIHVDGSVLASKDMPLAMSDKGNHDLVFGNPWGKDNFDGLVSNFTLDALGDTATANPQAIQTNDDVVQTDTDDTDISAPETQAPHAFANAQAWADQGLITEDMLDRFERIMANQQDSYFE